MPPECYSQDGRFANLDVAVDHHDIRRNLALTAQSSR